MSCSPVHHVLHWMPSLRPTLYLEGLCTFPLTQPLSNYCSQTLTVAIAVTSQLVKHHLVGFVSSLLQDIIHTGHSGTWCEHGRATVLEI